MGEVIQLARRRASAGATEAPRAATLLLRPGVARTRTSPPSASSAASAARAGGRRAARHLSASPLARRAGARDARDARRRARAASCACRSCGPSASPRAVPPAMRVATLAAEQGRGPAFALAAGRLAFCGGFDLEDPDILAEAAAAAGLDVDDALAAAREPRRDDQIERPAARCRAEGGTTLPALELGGGCSAASTRITRHGSRRRRRRAAGRLSPRASVPRAGWRVSASSSRARIRRGALSQSTAGWTGHCDTRIAGSAGATR